MAQKKIVGYYGSWARYRPSNGQCRVEDLDPDLCTHLIYAFCGIDESGAIKLLDNDSENMKKFNALKQRNRNLKTMVAVGGYNLGSAIFSNMARSATKRQTFISSAGEFLRQHGFDGLDIDWEYPGRNGGDASCDKTNFTLLLQELKSEFRSSGFLLSAAVSATEDASSQSYDIPEISKYLDFINVMTYDLRGSWDGFVGVHSGLYANSRDTSQYQRQLNVDACIKYWLSRGAPPYKLVMGVPFYARTFTLANSNNTEIGSASAGAGRAGPYTREAGSLGYNEICEKFNTEKWTLKWEQNQLVPYAYYGDQWIGYENPASIKIKTEYVISKGLGGIMVWSIDTDDFGGRYGKRFPLLQTINSD